MRPPSNLPSLKIKYCVPHSSSFNPLENGRGDLYTYDAEGQLTDALYLALTPAATPSAWQREEHFQLDPLGNRKQVARNGGAWQQ